MPNIFLENQLEIRAQRQKLEELRQQFDILTSPHLKSSSEKFSLSETPEQVSAYIREQAASREVAFQLAITENALQKVRTAVRLIRAQMQLAQKTDASANSDVALCLRHDKVQLNELFGKAARAVSKIKDVKPVVDVLPHTIKDLFGQVHEDVVQLYGPTIASSAMVMTDGQLIEEIAQQRLKFGEQILCANRKHLGKVETTLNHTDYLERVRLDEDVPTIPALEDAITIRIDYLSSAMGKCDDRVKKVRSYMETIYDMGAGERDYFHPVRYNYAPLNELF